VEYVYDGDGQRVKKSSGRLYWGAGPLAESDANGTLVAEYVFVNGQRAMRRDVSTGAMHYYFLDHLGSTSVVANSSGTIENESDYLPFGEENAFQNATEQHFKFTGKERDTETGLDYFGARYYASTMGRFMSPDWAATATAVPYADFGDPQTLNLYGYVRNNPLSHADGDGHCCSDEWSYLKAELGGAWSSTGGAMITLGKSLISGEAAHNIATTAGWAITDPRKIGSAAGEFVSQTAQLGRSALHGNPHAIGQIAGLVIGPKVTGTAINTVAKGLNVAAFGSSTGRVFWSGAGTEQMASQFGRVLSQTPAGRLATALDNAGLQGTATSQFMWNRLSAGFARGASGDTLTFNFNSRLNTTFMQVERPILVNSPSANLLTMGTR